MMKFKFLSVAMMLAAVTASAETFRSMVIETYDGNDMTINLSSELTTTFADGEMLFKGDNVNVAVPMAAVKGWSYSNNVYDAVADNVAEDGVSLSDRGDCIVIYGLKDASQVSLCTVDGRVLLNEKVSGEYTLGLTDLVKGVYVLTVNKQSFKIAVNR